MLTLIRADEQGRREFAGSLLGYTAETVTIATEEGEAAFERSAAASIKADDDKDI